MNGRTYLRHHDFVSRVFALTWVFPLRDDYPREIRRRSLNANNCAFRHDWFAARRFPDHCGFKVSCSLLAAQIRENGTALVQADAFARHEPLEGWRFLLWRAMVAGRDDDARYATLSSPARGRRVARAFGRWVKQLLRSTRRIVTQHRAVGMPIYEVPPAIVAAWFYYSTTFVSQIGSAISGPRMEPERVPEFVLRH